ncbi:MAG: sugar ABC transporter permease YjfF [Clostridiales bacterium]|jgi:simple sugar transport system permease protein|nr:sugar ABC transporter permease YjfF [Clostridiales bacterium]
MNLKKLNIRKHLVGNLSLLITCGLFVVLCFAGIISFHFQLRTFLNLLNSNSYLLIVAVGVSFVLLTGGIDISVASTVAFTCMFSAFLMQLGVSPAIVIPLVLLLGFLFGDLMGFLINRYEMQPFIVTLAGLFFLRGMCAVISTTSIAINNDFYTVMSLGKITLGKGENIYYHVLIALIIVTAAYYILRFTKFGRSVYAVGGSAQSAHLMGLPVKRITVMVYAISGFCAALGGVVYSFTATAGDPLQNMGLELDAISSAVIGGTLLSGGVGSVIGTGFGVLIQGIVQTIVVYLNLNTWWTKVVNAALLCIFIVIQRMISSRSERAKRI